MQKFKNGDDVLWCPEPDFAPDDWDSAFYIGRSVGGKCSKHVLSVGNIGRLIYCLDDHIKPKPTTININRVEVPKPDTFEFSNTLGKSVITVIYNDPISAREFMGAIKEGCDDE